MARPANLSNINIAELQRVLNAKRGELEKLHRQRAQLQKRMNVVDRQIARLGGGAAGGMNGSRRGGAGSRVRNEHSLVETIEGVLKSSGKPMKVAEIMEGVLATGYRSGSASFRGIINQTLIKERKRFAQAGRGVYELKSGGSRKTSKSAA